MTTLLTDYSVGNMFMKILYLFIDRIIRR